MTKRRQRMLRTLHRSAIAALMLAVALVTTPAAFAQSFIDDPLTAGMAVRSVHIVELRLNVAILRAFMGRPVFLFSDAILTPGVTPARAAHITELRSALADVFDAAGVTRPVYTDPALAGVLIKAAHINELRAAILQIADLTDACLIDGGTLINGATACGTIARAAETDLWTFTANAGDRIGIHIGETADADDFRPWVRLLSPSSAVLADTAGIAAAVVDNVVAPVTGTYTVTTASFDSLFDGTGAYRLTMTHTPGPITVSPDDEGGPLINGALPTGEIVQGDVDIWTFTATAGDRIGIHIGEITDTDDFRPSIRLWSPSGATLGSSFSTDAAVLDGVVAPVTGTYLLLVASFDSGFDGEGTYRLTMVRTPGPTTVSPGDQGGPLTNGALHTGTVVQGDVDVWTFAATAGDRIAAHIGEITETDDFRPWLRLWAPNGADLGNTAGTDAAVIDNVIAPVTGTYLVLVSSFDSGADGEGTYRLTMTRTPGPITVSPGDEGGPLINGALPTGEIVQGDVDIWTFTATAGDRIGIHIGEITDTDDFRPSIRLWAPSGATLGSAFGTDAAVFDGVVAPVTGTYLLLVASSDSGFDGEGTYRVTMVRTPGPITVSPSDQGGPLISGGVHSGEILQGDVDVWTITATAGQLISATVSETLDTDDYRPWVRIWAPNGTILGSSSGLTSAQILDVPAIVTGTYLVLISSFDSGFDGTGLYQLTVTLAP